FDSWEQRRKNNPRYEIDQKEHRQENHGSLLLPKRLGDTVLPNSIPMRMFSRYVFLARHVKISPSYKIKSSSFTTHKSGSQPQSKLRTATKTARRKQALREDFKGYRKILNCRRKVSFVETRCGLRN